MILLTFVLVGFPILEQQDRHAHTSTLPKGSNVSFFHYNKMEFSPPNHIHVAVLISHYDKQKK